MAISLHLAVTSFTLEIVTVEGWCQRDRGRRWWGRLAWWRFPTDTAKAKARDSLSLVNERTACDGNLYAPDSHYFH